MANAAVMQEEKVGQRKEVPEMWLTVEGLTDNDWMKQKKGHTGWQTSEHSFKDSAHDCSLARILCASPQMRMSQQELRGCILWEAQRWIVLQEILQNRI